MSKSRETSESTAFYTVPEFAELAGVSKQAVYQRIKKDLKGYTRKEAGVTVISGDALDLVGSKVDQAESSTFNFAFDYESSEVEQAVNQLSKADESSSQAVKSSGQSSKAAESSGLLDYMNSKEGILEYLMSDIDNLRREIDRLHGDIERLNGVISDKDAKISEFAERFAGLAEKEQEISSRALATTGQAQMLHAMSEQSAEQPEVIDAPQEPQEAEKPRRWWHRKRK